jgi:hypothetical protein
VVSPVSSGAAWTAVVQPGSESVTTPTGLAGGVAPLDACAAGLAGPDAEQPAATMATAVSARAPRARLVSRLDAFVPRLDAAVLMSRPQDPEGQLTTVARSCDTAASPATPTALPQLTTTRGQPACGPACRPGSVEMPNVSPGQIEESP